MNPGEFNQLWGQLAARLQRAESPQVKLNALIGLIEQSRAEFSPRDQWPQKMRIIFAAQESSHVQSLFSTEFLLNLPPERLESLWNSLSEVMSVEDSVKPYLEKVRVAQVMQLLYVGDIEAASGFLGGRMSQSSAGTLAERAAALLAAFQQHSLVTHLTHLVEQWVRESGSAKLSTDHVNILLFSPAQQGAKGFGVLTKLRFTPSDASPQKAGMVLPPTSVQAAQRWFRQIGYAVTEIDGVLSCDDLNNDVTGNSHTLAVAALISAGIESRRQPWQSIGFASHLTITGELDGSGWVHPVENLREKLTRAFYSPLLVAAVPADQQREAEELVSELRQKHPQRDLRILGVGSLASLLNPPVQGLQRKFDPVKWLLHRGSVVSRAIFAVASLLFLTGSVQLALHLNPKLSPWFDWQPEYWDVQDGQRVVLSNRKQQVISTVRLDPPWRPGVGNDPEYANSRTISASRSGQPDTSQFYYRIDNEARNRCALADVNGDGLREVLFRCTSLDAGDSIWHRVLVYCLAKQDDFPWFHSNYEVLWKRVYEYENFEPLVRRDSRYPIEASGMVTVDWQGTGQSNVILSVNDCKPQNNSCAYLEELDGRTGEVVGRFWHTQWFFGLTAISELNGASQTLWAGTFSHTEAAPELFIFHDSLGNRVWPCADTAGFRALRYPNSDVALAFGVPTHISRIVQDHQRKSEIRIIVGSTQHHVDAHTDWRGYTFLVNHDVDWLGDSFDRSYLQHLIKFERDGYIKLPPDIDDWLPPLTYAEEWTGSTWIPADKTRPRPDPYPLFERKDPRWSNIKLPVRWQELN